MYLILFISNTLFYLPEFTVYWEYLAHSLNGLVSNWQLAKCNLEKLCSYYTFMPQGRQVSYLYVKEPLNDTGNKMIKYPGAHSLEYVWISV